MAKGRGFQFGDAGTDKIALYAVLGLVAYVLFSTGKGLTTALGNVGATLQNATGVAAGASGIAAQLGSGVTGTADGIWNAGRSFGANYLDESAPFTEPDGSQWIPYNPGTYQGATGGW